MENTKEFALLFQPPASMQIIEEQKDLFLRKKISLYIHIPFCEKKCFFCSIVTCQKFTDDYIEQYVRVLEKEILDYKSYFAINTVSCIHIGGGTPSLLTEGQIVRIFTLLAQCIPNFNEIEVVFEGEASSLSDAKIDFLAQSGRISMNLGVQTFDPKVIRKINRWSSPELIMDRLNRIAAKNFRAVGIDIMCNLPGSTLETTLADIDTAMGLKVNHISLYPLRVEPDSIFHDYQPKYEQSFIDDEKQLSNYAYAAEYLRNNGYDHYSIFHFSNKSEETYLYSRNQMHGGEWIGLGVAAYSYFNGCVFANTRNLDEYMRTGGQNHPNTWYEKDNNTIKNIIRQFVFSLRITRLNKQYYVDKYGEPIYKMCFVPLFNYLSKEGFLQESNGLFQLSDKGIVNFPKIEGDLLDNYQSIINGNAMAVASMH